MNLIKKIVSCGLAVSLVLSGVYANAVEPVVDGKKSIVNSLTTKQKIIGGISAIGGIGLLSTVGISTWRHYHNLPVLIIGSDESVRADLIKRLKNREMMDNSPQPSSLISVIEWKIATGVLRGAKGVGMTRARFENWDISECDANPADSNAKNLMKKARLIVVVLTDDGDADTINGWISQNVKRDACAVVSIYDKNVWKHKLDNDVEFRWNREDNIFECAHWAI